MTRKEFLTELKTVVNYLWRNPYITGTVRVHLLSYFDESKSLPELKPGKYVQYVHLVAYNGHKYMKSYKTDCLRYAYDLCYMMDLLIDEYFIMYEILEDYVKDAARVKRIMRSWISKISRWQISITELGLVCKTMTELILSPLADSDSGIPRQLCFGVLNASIKRKCPNLHWFFHPLKDIIEAYAKGLSEKEFYLLYQASEYILRGQMKSLDLLKQQKAEYLAFEEDIRTRDCSDEIWNDFESACALCMPQRHEAVMRRNLVPTHGSGAVCNWPKGTSRYAKYCMVDWQNRKVLKILPELADYIPLRHTSSSGIHPNYSEIVNVPKNLLKDRLISKEEAFIQFAQHAVQYAQVKLFEDPDSIWFDHIDLSDADRNGRLAALGSYAGEFATLDQSAASDSVTLHHILRMPQWYRKILMAVRCGNTSYDHQLVKLWKFAPMGAATCFPVECQVFCLACILAIVKYHHLSIGNLTEEQLRAVLAHSRFMVYGDDIVIEERYVALLKDVLARLGFTVNDRKSYTQRHTCNFRESCGYEYLNGVSVSPLRTARQRNLWLNRLLSLDQVAQLVEYHNLAAKQCLRYLQRLWRWRIRHTSVRVRMTKGYVQWPVSQLIPFVHIDDYVGGLQCITQAVPTNYHLVRGGLGGTLDSDYQRSRYWGLAECKIKAPKLDLAEADRLRRLGFHPVESEACRWLDYWISKQKHGSPLDERPCVCSTNADFDIKSWENLVGLDAIQPIPDLLQSRPILTLVPVYE